MIFNTFLSGEGNVKNINLSLYIAKKNKKISFNTNLTIHSSCWDYDKERPINIYLKKNKQIHLTIGAIKLCIIESLDTKKIISKKKITDKISKIINGHKLEISEDMFLYQLKNYIQLKKEIICNSTYKRYNVFYNLLEKFEIYSLKRLYTKHINNETIANFISFAKEENYSESTIYKTIHFIKTILNFVERKGIRTKVRELELKKEKNIKNIITLTENEIQKIEVTTVNSKLKPAKEWLLISCYTGQRFSDFMNFDKSKIVEIKNRKYLSFRQLKTQKSILLPLHPIVLKIIQENNGEFPKKISLTDYNQQIKIIAKKAGINEVLEGKKRIENRSKSIRVNKWELISSHIGRRSFSTNFYGKIPTPLLMQATGHGTEQMFLKYINTLDETRIISLSNYFNKLYIQKS